MLRASDAPRRRWSWAIAVGLLTSLPFSLLLILLINRAWADCDVGINAAANLLWSIIVVLPVLVLISGVLVCLTVRFLRIRATLLAIVVAMMLLAVAWIVLAIEATPSDYPAGICPGNVPPWLPEWLPL